uniref:Replication-associated protein n=1 Tax=Prunus geminivirus A TaxID=2022321 RepID=A0A455HFC4_9GEMI|nr:RepA/C1 protein [Prunus geminivirus A]
MASTSFNLRSKNFFLTYPQCPVIKQFALDFFKSKFNKTLEYALVSQEKHQDGEPHLHALLIFKKRQCVRNPKHFDITISSHSYHPNITKPRNVKDVHEYVSKDGDHIEFGEKPRLHDRSRSREVDFGEYLKISNSREEFFNLVKANYPYQYILNLQRLEYFANQAWPPMPSPHVRQWTTWNNLPPEVLQWVNTELFLVRKDRAGDILSVGQQNILQHETYNVRHIIDDMIDTHYIEHMERLYESDNVTDVAGDQPEEEVTSD